MFKNSYESRRIEEIKRLNAFERSDLTQDLAITLPLLRKVGQLGVYAVALKSFAPAARPIFFGLVQRGLAKRGRSGLYKMAGIVSTAIGLSRLFRSDSSRKEQALLK